MSPVLFNYLLTCNAFKVLLKPDTFGDLAVKDIGGKSLLRHCFDKKFKE